MLGLAAGCWLLGAGEWGFILPDYDVAAAAAWLLCHGPDPRPTAPATATANTPGCRDSPHDTTASSTARYNNASHNSTTQHQLLLSDPRLARCSVLAACRSSQQRSAFRPPPSPALAEYFKIFYTAEYLHISVITACTRGRGCLGSGYGGVR